MTAHAAASPSSAAMWMSCPASITKSAGKTRPSSRYAREGTAAHTIAEMIISGCLWPPGKITVEGEQFIVGLPMLRALNPYIDYVQGLQENADDIHIEARVKIGNGALVWGTTDCAAISNTVVDIVDLKYGMGVPVAPDSAQLKIYACAAIDTFWRKDYITAVRLTVIQPRLDIEPKTFFMSIAKLADWAEEELDPAMRRIIRGDETEKVGPYCRWCVRKPECAAYKAQRGEQAAEIFNDGVDLSDA
jgi:hypothetical protein